MELTAVSNPTPLDPALPPQDPYCLWAKDSNFADYGPIEEDAPIAVLVECISEQAVKQLDTTLRGWGNGAAVQPAYLIPITPSGTLLSRFCTIRIPRNRLDRLNGESALIARWQLGIPVIRSRMVPYALTIEAEVGQTRESAPTLLTGVIAAVIDDYFATDHTEFQDQNDSSRIKFLWSQSETGVPGPPPTGFDYGQQWVSPASSGVGAKSTTRLASSPAQPNARASHGTAVAAVLCGKTSPWHGLTRFDPARAPARYADDRDPASNVGIVFVELPGKAVSDTSGGALHPNVLDALRYIISRCDSNAKIVVNISYGGLAGPHDGSSMLEMAIADLVAKLNPNLFVVFPEGNGREAMCHANFDLEAGKPTTLSWKVMPDCRTPSFMQIWLPSGAKTDGLSISLESPAGASATAEVKVGWKDLMLDPKGKPIGSLYFLPEAALGTGRAMAFMALPPTASMESERTPAQHGLWKVKVSSQTENIADVHAWIERNDTAPGKGNFGRQSRFADDNYVRCGTHWSNPKDSASGYVRRSGTTNNVATTDSVEVVGGFQLSDATRAAYSAGGKAGRIRGPFLLAPSEESHTQHGLRVPGNHSGDSLRIRGTSVAAPFWGRYALKLFVDGLVPPTSKAVHAITLPLPLPLPPNLKIPPTQPVTIFPDPDLGFGCLDLRP